MPPRKRKPKFRFPALGAALAQLGSIAVIVAKDPHVLQTAAGKIGLSVATLASLVQAIAKPILREDHER